MKLTIASSPHIRGNFRTNRIMLDVVLALLPALAVGTAVLGLRSLLVALICVAAAVVAEWFYCAITKSRNTTLDCSAMVTGLLLAMTLPHTVPYWQAAMGSIFAIILVKCLWGGLGQNIFNPALAARAFLLLIYPLGVTRYEGLDGVTAATPLHHMQMPALPEEVTEQVEISVKYEGYIQRQDQDVKELRRLEQRVLPEGIDYHSIQGLRLEAREKLSAIRPLNLGQAGRISGVSPADVAALMIHLERIDNK